MSNSPLASYVRLSPNHSGRRNHAIDTITPHYVDGNCAVEALGDIFAPRSRQASSNYGIGSDGRVGMYVEEHNRAWTSGSAANDNRAVTIECANLADGSLTDACWSRLVELCADICRRNGKARLVYRGRADYSGLRSTDMLLTMHKWFQDTDCPGPWLSNKFYLLCNRVNALLTPPQQKPGKAANSYGLHYRAHQQAAGWLPSVRDGQVAGITGNALRLEAIKITPPEGVELEVTLHIQDIGDKVWRGIRKGKSSGTGSSSTDPIMGTVGKSKRIEGIRIDVAKNANAKLKGKTLYYRVHVQNLGWTRWVKAGTFAGTRGKALRLEAIQMKME